MSDPIKPPPPLRKPPGYRDPSVPAGKPAPMMPPPATRKTALPPSFRPRKRRRSCSRVFCCCFCILFLVIVILLLFAGGLFFIWFDPKPPVFHLQSFKVSRFTVTTNSEGTVLNAVTVARVEVRNPNGKLTFHYGKSEVGITAGKDGDTSLGSATLPGFTQGKKNTTSLKVEAKVKDELVEDKLGKKLQAQFRSKELLVNVEVKTSVGLGLGGGLKIGMLNVKVMCQNIKLKKLGGAGVLPKCTINTLKWINIH